MDAPGHFYVLVYFFVIKLIRRIVSMKVNLLKTETATSVFSPTFLLARPFNSNLLFPAQYRYNAKRFNPETWVFFRLKKRRIEVNFTASNTTHHSRNGFCVLLHDGL